MSHSSEKKISRGIAASVKFLTRLIIWSFCFVLVCGGLYWQRDAVARYALLSYLHKNGFPAARLQHINIELYSAKITKLKLSDEFRIDDLRTDFHFTPGDDYPVFIDYLALSGISYQEPPLQENVAETDISALLRKSFVLAQKLPLDKIDIKQATARLQKRGAYLPQSITITAASTALKNITDHLKINAAISAQNGDSLAGIDCAAILYENGNAAADLTLRDESVIRHPLISMSNIDGAAHVALKSGMITAENAAITIGAAQLVHLPLENITLSYNETAEGKTLEAAGKSPGDIAGFNAEFNFNKDRELSGKADINAKNLEQFYALSKESFSGFENFAALEKDLKNVKGSARLVLNFSGKKPLAELNTDIATWQDFSGNLQIAAKGLTLPPHLHKTGADIKLHFSHNADGILIFPESLAADGKTGSDKTAFQLKLDPKPNSTHLLLKHAGDVVDFRLPQLQLSYGDMLDYSGGLSGTIDRIGSGFELTEAAGRLKLPVQKITIDLYEATAKGGYHSKAETKASVKTAVTLPDNIAPVLRVDADLTYTAAKDLLRFDSKLRDQASHANAHITGFVTPATQKGEINIEMPPVTFDPVGTQPHHLSPKLAGLLQKVSGSAGFSAKLSLPDLRGTGQLLLKNLSAEISGKPVTNLNAALEIKNVIPPVLDRQIVAVESFNPGIPFFGGLVTLSYDAEQLLPLTLHNAEWQMAGGTVSFADVKLDPAKPDTAFSVMVRDLSLQQLLQFAKVEGLKANGMISGSLPLRVRGDEIFIENGVISTTTPGTVQYAPNELPAFLQNGNPNMDFVRNVISNFHYESLRFLLDGKAGGDQTIRLEAKGRNPDMAETRPVALNLNLQGALENIFQHHVQAYTIPDNIREKIRQYEEKHVPSP
ncbi:MAG: hypothetical protein EP349_03565 [Alphaproteobacteria bacterium]|nr:MAG: hypothetical protein EP349_03565 [Alphaproteobacteria bacterium]